MKKLLPLTAIALHLSISLSVKAQDLPPVEAPLLVAELAPPAIPALAPLVSKPAEQARGKAKTKDKPIEPIMALPAAPALLADKAVKPVKTQSADPLDDLVHTLMMAPVPPGDLLEMTPAPRPVADLAKPRTDDPLGELVKPLVTRPVADLARPPAADPLGDLADVLDAPLVLEPVPPASIDPLDDLAKIRAASPR